MFNTKRIIFLIGLLSLVTLTGALMAGPAFAKPKDGGDHGKVLICHFAEAEAATFDAEGGLLTEAEDAYWKVINVDPSAMDAHLGDGGEVAAHNDGNRYTDMLIDNGEVAAENTTTSTDCDGREVRA